MTGVITAVFGRFYTVTYDGGEVNSVLRGRMKTSSSVFSNPAAVGDIVEFSVNKEGLGVIESVCDRKNTFTRKDGVRSREDIIACNLDQVIAVQAFTNPRLNLRFVDRIIVRSKKGGIPVLLCVNKSDLMERGEPAYIRSYYKGTDISIKIVSAHTGKGIADFKKEVSGKRSLLIGYSGVGKSSLFNRLFPGIDLKTSEVSESSGKGRHTTTNVSMIRLDDSTELIDTPGVREFGLVDIAPDDLGNYFKDFSEAALNCRFRPCTHDHEPGCEVKRLVEDGAIHYDRYVSYLNILYSIRENLKNQY